MTGRIPEACHTNLHGYQLVLTCREAPEQYDVRDRHANLVGYIRQRHGHVRAYCPDCAGDLVYEADTAGGYNFDPDERLHHLWHAVLAIEGTLRPANPLLPPVSPDRDSA